MGWLERIGLRAIDRLLGVDLGTNSMKLCVLKEQKGRLVLEHLTQASYREDILNDGYIIDPFFVGTELKRLMSQEKIKATHAASAVSSYSVISKYISVPAVEEEEFEDAIRPEIEAAIPIPLSEMYYSFCPVGFSQEREELVDVFVVAVKRGIVDDFRKAFELAGLTLEILDVDLLAMCNLVEEIYGPVDSAVMVMDIGSSVTNLAILKEGRVQFSREILFGGNALTRSIEKVMSVPYEEAEERKKAFDPEVSDLIEDFIFNIISEIRKTTNFYLSAKPNESLGAIYLTGGSARLQGLKERISDEIGIATELVDPFKLLSGELNVERYEELRYGCTLAVYLASRVRDLKARGR